MRLPENVYGTSISLTDTFPCDTLTDASGLTDNQRPPGAVDFWGRASPSEIDEVLVLGLSNGTLSFLDCFNSGEIIVNVLALDGRVEGLKYRPHSKQLLTFGFDMHGTAATLSVWNAADMTLQHTIAGITHCSCWQEAPRLPYVAVGCLEGTVRLFCYAQHVGATRPTGIQSNQPSAHHSRTTRITTSDRDNAVTGSLVGKGASSGHIQGHIKSKGLAKMRMCASTMVEVHGSEHGHDGTVLAISFCDELRVFVTAAADFCVVVWTYDKTNLRTLMFNKPVRSVAFNGPDHACVLVQGNYLLSSPRHIWDGGLLLEHQREKERVHALQTQETAFTYSATSEHDVSLFSASEAALLNSLTVPVRLRQTHVSEHSDMNTNTSESVSVGKASGTHTLTHTQTSFSADSAQHGRTDTRGKSDSVVSYPSVTDHLRQLPHSSFSCGVSNSSHVSVFNTRRARIPQQEPDADSVDPLIMFNLAQVHCDGKSSTALSSSKVSVTPDLAHLPLTPSLPSAPLTPALSSAVATANSVSFLLENDSFASQRTPRTPLSFSASAFTPKRGNCSDVGFGGQCFGWSETDLPRAFTEAESEDSRFGLSTSDLSSTSRRMAHLGLSPRAKVHLISSSEQDMVASMRTHLALKAEEEKRLKASTVKTKRPEYPSPFGSSTAGVSALLKADICAASFAEAKRIRKKLQTRVSLVMNSAGNCDKQSIIRPRLADEENKARLARMVRQVRGGMTNKSQYNIPYNTLTKQQPLTRVLSRRLYSY